MKIENVDKYIRKEMYGDKNNETKTKHIIELLIKKKILEELYKKD